MSAPATMISRHQGLPRRVGVRLAVTLTLAIGLSVSTALPTLASTSRVEQGSFTFSVDEFDSGLCGFPIEIQSQATINFTFLTDGAGNATALLIHFSIADGTLSANGVSLRQGSNHNTTIVFYDSAGNPTTQTIVGLTTQIFLAGGAAIEGGRLYEDIATGDVTFDGKAISSKDALAVCGALGG